MSALHSAAGTPVSREAKSREIAIGTLVLVVGIGFNLLRLELRLDQGPLTASLVAFFALAVVAGLMGHWAGLDRQRLGLALPRPMPAIVGGALAAAVLIGTALATAPVTRLPTVAQMASGVALFGFGTAPAEELLFRGVLYGAIERNAGVMAAITVSSIAFAAVHVPVYGVGSLPVAFSAGLLLGWLRWWSRSLLAPSVVHAAADLSLLWL